MQVHRPSQGTVHGLQALSVLMLRCDMLHILLHSTPKGESTGGQKNIAIVIKAILMGNSVAGLLWGGAPVPPPPPKWC